MPPSIDVFTAESAIPMSSDITALYVDVFASPPWNEAFQCDACKRSFPRGSADAVCCGANVREYYPFDRTKAEIERCFGNVRSRIAATFDGENGDRRLVGFAWGWEESLGSLNDGKLHLSEDSFERVRRRCGVDRDDPLFYFSEFGVREEMRGRGLGKRMYRELFSSIDRSDARGILMRTSMESPAFHVASSSPDYPMYLTYEYGDDLRRVILSSFPSDR